jgi:hypothetical protein
MPSRFSKRLRITYCFWAVTEGKGVLQVHRRRRWRECGLAAAAEDAYYREHVAPLVDGTQITNTAWTTPRKSPALQPGVLHPVQAR